MKNFISRSLEDTKKLAEIIAKIMKGGDTLFLNGDLGAGKTAFVRYLISALLNQNIDVTSPTFSIMNLYSNDDLSIAHMDLYRLKTKGDLVETGVIDSLGTNISLIEWPDLLKGMIDDFFEISIKLRKGSLVREFCFNDKLSKLLDKNYAYFQ